MAEVGADYKGKAKAPSFYKPAPEPRSEPKQEKHWPLLIGGALAGAGILLYLRSRQSGSVGTAPVLSVAANPSADISQLQNMNNTVQEMLANPQLWQRTTTGQTVSSSPTPDSQQSVPPPNDTTPPPNNPPIISSTNYSINGISEIPVNDPQHPGLMAPVLPENWTPTQYLTYAQLVRQESSQWEGSKIVTDTAGMIHLLRPDAEVPKDWILQAVSQNGTIVPVSRG